MAEENSQASAARGNRASLLFVGEGEIGYSHRRVTVGQSDLRGLP